MLTRLDAVNQMLGILGETPVASLQSGYDEADDAEAALDRVSAEVQAKGWHCNTDYQYRLPLTPDGTIPVPDRILRVDTSGADQHINVSVREQPDGNRALYNIKDQTFRFDMAVDCDVVWQFDFEDLTPELQMYIAAKAGRENQESDMASVTLDSFARRREMEAYAALLDAESEVEDSNELIESPLMRRATQRVHYYGPWRR